MPIYSYKAKKGPSEILQGEIEANSQDNAVSKLLDMGLSPVSVIEKGVQGAGFRVQGAEKREEPRTELSARSEDIDIFTRQLASLIKAGVPVLRALSLIVSQTQTKTIKEVVAGLERDIRDGSLLSDSLGRYPRIFNGLFLSMIKAGEKGGALEEVLYKLSEYREKEQELRRKIQAAIAYPIFVIAVGILTIFLMLTFFLPKLVGLFESVEKLPLPTRILMSTSSFMRHNWYWIILAFVFGIVLLGGSKHGSKKKFFIDIIKLRLPIIKDFVRNNEIAKFSRTLGLLLKNGISVHESLQLAADTLDNEALREKLNLARQEILNKGSTLSASLKKVDLFPVFAVNMIAVGEEGGRLEESLAEIANVYEREVEQSMKIMASLLEPALILIVGGVVGFIVFAMMLPIFNIGLGAK